MPYCDISDIRLHSNLENEEVGDGRLRDLRDDAATAELNSDINQRVESEVVDYISEDKENNINGTNKTFYAREVHRSDRRIGDWNDDGEVDGNDIQAIFIDNDDNRVELNVTLVDDRTGEFTAEKPNGDAIDNGELRLNYSIAPVDEQTPHRLVKTACAQLTASYAFTRIDAGKIESFSVGSISVNSQSEAVTEMRKMYEKTVRKITQSEVMQSGENVNTTEGAFNDQRAI